MMIEFHANDRALDAVVEAVLIAESTSPGEICFRQVSSDLLQTSFMDSFGQKFEEASYHSDDGFLLRWRQIRHENSFVGNNPVVLKGTA